MQAWCTKRFFYNIFTPLSALEKCSVCTGLSKKPSTHTKKEQKIEREMKNEKNEIRKVRN